MRPRVSLDSYIEALDGAMRASSDKRASHGAIQDSLRDFATDPVVLKEILRRHIATPENMNSRHYPVLSIPIARTASIELVANCWITLPDSGTNLSTKAIHHHGEMLLSTATAFGPGYEHWMFRTPPYDANRDDYDLELLDRRVHARGSVAFVDSRTAHVPFYPPSLTITIALWTNSSPTTWRDHLKRRPALRRNSESLRRLLRRVGLARALDLKIVEYFDFTPTSAGFRILKDRWEFPQGPNADYLASMFSILQATKNEDLFSIARTHAKNPLVQDQALVMSLSDDLEAGRPIGARLSAGHTGAAHANFTAEMIEAALRSREVRS